MVGAWTLEEQRSCFINTFKAFSERAQRNADGTVNPNGFVAGATWWTAFNWYTPHTKLQTMGLFHMDRSTKKLVTDALSSGYLPYSSLALGSEINISGNSFSIINGDDSPHTEDGTAFGYVLESGGNVDNTFTIQNAGTEELTLSGSPKVAHHRQPRRRLQCHNAACLAGCIGEQHNLHG